MIKDNNRQLLDFSPQKYTSTKSVSVIVPCKNEEKYISRCLNALIEQKKRFFNFEIIVLDNGSTDNTPKLLNIYSKEIIVFSVPELSIPEIRNYGAQKAQKKWLAFIDADVEVDIRWWQQVEFTLQKLSMINTDITKVVLGSTCSIPSNPTWIEIVWFQQLQKRDDTSARYVNGANMVMHHSLFDLIGGFDKDYETGEDEKFCEDVHRFGGKIIKDNGIKVIHHGYPKTILQFFIRERWHGKNMVKYMLNPWKSRDLLLAIHYLIILLLAPVSLFLFSDSLIVLVLLLFCMIAPLLPLSYSRSGKNLKITACLTGLFLVYGLAHVLSLIDILFIRLKRTLYREAP